MHACGSEMRRSYDFIMMTSSSDNWMQQSYRAYLIGKPSLVTIGRQVADRTVISTAWVSSLPLCCPACSGTIVSRNCIRRSNVLQKCMRAREKDDENALYLLRYSRIRVREQKCVYSDVRDGGK